VPTTHFLRVCLARHAELELHQLSVLSTILFTFVFFYDWFIALFSEYLGLERVCEIKTKESKDNNLPTNVSQE
jgi:hypothetical protein